jgi:hypothetical protein
MKPRIDELELEIATKIANFPILAEAYDDILNFVSVLKRCKTNEDYYNLQKKLIKKVIQIQGHRSESRREQKRLKRKRSISSTAPALKTGEDRSKLEFCSIEINA